MLDGVSLDQLRTFVAAVDEGSFSAAARRLNRVQSAVSGWVSALEQQMGILASLPVDFPSLAADRLGTVPLVMVAARDHPLANFEGHIPKKELSKHVQLVLTDRSRLLAGRDYGVLSSTTWRLADLSTKYALLKDCVGWGGMPLHMVAKDIASGDLVALDVDGVPRAGTMLTISAVYPAAAPPGPAGRWLVEHLKDWSSAKESPEPVRASRTDRRSDRSYP